MAAYEIYNGEVVLTFNEKNHTYTIKDGATKVGRVPSVTGITKVIDKPLLIPWAVKCTVEFLERRIRPGVAMDEVEIASLLKESKSARFKISDAATGIGTVAHNWIENYINNKIEYSGTLFDEIGIVETDELPVNEGARNAVKAFLNWEHDKKIKWIYSERKIFSRKYKYAGTLDLEYIRDGKYILGDIKTSKAIYPEYGLQLAAYILAREEEDPNIHFDGAEIIRIDKVTGEFDTVYYDREMIEDHISTFLACHNIFMWQKEYAS
jgi:hypothetical protein